MSDSEKRGRCRQQLEAWYANNSSSVPRYSWMVADAIDRLAADVAAVKDMAQEIALRVPSELGRDACDAAVRVLEKERDAAIRERDEARAEVERLKRDGTQAPDDLGILQDAHGLSERCKELASRIAMQQIEARAERVKAELEQQPAGNPPKTPDSSTAAPQPAGQGISPGLLETQPTQNAAPAAGWLTEREQHALRHILAADVEPAIRSILARAGSPPEQAAAGWLRDEERELLQSRLHALRVYLRSLCKPAPGSVKREVEIIDALLARAGSPPVVEVPELGFLGPMTGREQGIVLAYRDALDAAGVPWKEVPRE